MPDSRLSNDLRSVSCLDCGVVMLNLMDFAMNTGGKRVTDLSDGFVCLELQLVLL